MKKLTHRFFSALDYISRLHWLSLIIVIVAVVILLGLIVWGLRGTSVGIIQDEGICVTPTQIRAIEDIGEWEFLSVSDEELIDTVAHGFFGDSELVRIYYGTLRLGINLHEATPGWIKAEKIQLLSGYLRSNSSIMISLMRLAQLHSLKVELGRDRIVMFSISGLAGRCFTAV